MEFDDFFNHQFIRKNQQSAVSPPLPVLASVRLSTPPRTMPAASSPTTAVNTTAAVAVANVANKAAQNNNAPTPEEADDFVLVPSPSQLRSRTNSSGATTNHNEGDASAQPIPVPSQRGAFLKVCMFNKPHLALENFTLTSSYCCAVLLLLSFTVIRSRLCTFFLSFFSFI